MTLSIIYNNTSKTFNSTGDYILNTNGVRCVDNITIMTNLCKLRGSYGGNVIFNAGTDGTIVFPVKNKTMTSDVVLNVTPLHVDIMLSRFYYGTGGTLKSITFT